MIKLRIEKIDRFNYQLKDINNKEYSLKLEFYDLPRKLEPGDILYMHEKYVRDENTLFSFGPLEGKYGCKITSEKDPDLLVLELDKEKIYLKRYYG